MTDLDPSMLEKLQRFQAMLAASPEIVEALNSPEILALAAKAAEEKKNAEAKTAEQKKDVEPVFEPEPELESEPEPEYPIVGYGVSDEVSVMSEMTTPTVMTRQTVEEDEFYPEIDVAGNSSSGIFSGPRRIGLKIGVSSYKDGDLPPPPPKSKPKSRHHRSTTRKIKPIAPMSKITENDSTDNDGESSELKSTEFKSKKSTWKPIAVSPVIKEKKEPHPFLASSGAGTARRTARHSTYTNRSARRSSKSSRVMNKNQSIPGSAISGSLQEEDDITNDSSEIISSPSDLKEKEEPKPKQKPKSLSPSRPNNIDLGSGTEKPSPRSAPIERGVARNRSLPTTSKQSSGSRSVSSKNMSSKNMSSKNVSSKSIGDYDDDTAKISSGSASSPSDTEEKSLPLENNNTQDTNLKIFGGKKKRGKSVPKMRLVPVLPTKNEAIVTSKSSHAKLTRPDQAKSRPRGRSLSKRKTPSVKSVDRSHSPEQKAVSSKNDINSDPISDGEGTSSNSSNPKSELSESDSTGSENSNDRIPVPRRWKPPITDDSAIPPAFRSSSQRFKFSGSNHSGKSIKSSNSRVSSIRSKSSDSTYSEKSTKLSSSKESRSEEQKDISSSSSEDDYVRQAVRKPPKVASRPDPEQFKQYMTEISQVIQSDSSRPDDYLPGSCSPFTGTRRKKLQSVKKTFNNTSELRGPRSDDWLGSGKVQKRSWKAKKSVEC